MLSEENLKKARVVFGHAYIRQMMLAVCLSATQAPCVALMWTNRPCSVDENAVATQAGDVYFQGKRNNVNRQV
jgi:hypothetical protein